MNKYYIKDGVIVKIIPTSVTDEAEPEYDSIIEKDLDIVAPVILDAGDIRAKTVQEISDSKIADNWHLPPNLEE